MESEIFGSFSAEEDRRVEEVDVCHRYALLDWPLPRTLIDVGAHRGSSSIAFLESGWSAWAFEPDATNRAHLIKRCEAFIVSGKMTVDSRAVSDHVSEGVPFFSSEESSGVSSMLDFLDSHRESATVPVTTLKQYLSDHEALEPGILKIDTEGFDLHVLRGFPWDRCKPGIVVVEFEDKKTQKLGYTCAEMQEFLIAQGYRVFVSEWHPIVRYGIAHQWKALWQGPKTDLGPDAWGNLIALRQDLPDERFLEIFESKISSPASRAAASNPPASQTAKMEKLKRPGKVKKPQKMKVQNLEPMNPIQWSALSEALAASERTVATTVRDALAARTPGLQVTSGAFFQPARAVAVFGLITFCGVAAAVGIGMMTDWVAALSVLAGTIALIACAGVGILALELRLVSARLGAAERVINMTVRAAKARADALSAIQAFVARSAEASRNDAAKLEKILVRFDRLILRTAKRKGTRVKQPDESPFQTTRD